MLARLRERFALAPRTLALVWKASRAGTLGLGALTLAAAMLPLAIAWVGKRIVDAVVARDSELALRQVGLELALVAGLSLAQRGLMLLRSVLGSRLALDVNVLILEKALTLELTHFEDPEFYDRLTRARREASSRPISMVVELFSMVQNALTLVGYATLLVGLSGWAVGGLVAAALPATFAEMRFSTLAFRMRNRRAPENRRLNYLEHVLANDGHAKEVKLFGLGPLFLSRYRELGERVYQEDKELASRRARWAWALSLLATLAFYGCYGWLAVSAALGRIGLGDLTLYVVAFRQGQQAFQSVLSSIGGMYEHNLYMSNLFEYLALPTGPAAPALPAAAGRGDGVRFEKVGFRYPGQEGWVLRGLDLHIPHGQSLALVGENGSGKTTLIKLLTGLYRPTEGRILLDGVDLASWDREALRRRIGVIFQDFNRYQLALKENVGVGSVPHLDDDGKVRAAVERGGATELAAALPQGLETPLGKWFKLEGVELSGGQWQKVALARAFMREDADVLVLDEPTAALDAEAEHAVFERFRALARGRTTLLISHRFPTVRTADRILVLEGGKILEEGNHAALLERGGKYARLFRLQAEGYL